MNTCFAMVRERRMKTSKAAKYNTWLDAPVLCLGQHEVRVERSGRQD
jgi:hypothetical protein